MMLAADSITERWHEAIAALVEHREECTRCRPGGVRCETGQRLHEAQQAAYLEARR